MTYVYFGVVLIVLAYILSVLWFLRRSDGRPHVSDPGYAAWAKRMEQARQQQDNEDRQA